MLISELTFSKAVSFIITSGCITYLEFEQVISNMHDDEMDRFIQEQKHRLDNERKLLENNPPSAVTDYILQDVEHDKIPSRHSQAVNNNRPSAQVFMILLFISLTKIFDIDYLYIYNR